MAQSGSYRQINGSNVLGPTTNCPTCTITLNITDCISSLVYTVEIGGYTLGLGSVYEFQVGTPGSGAVYCGTVSIGNGSSATATLVNGIVRTCGDTIHCVQ